MTQHLYRFRPLRWLLDENELRNQEIYFAETSQLNDPMEGFRDVFWHGDAIVWKNLLRHYVICLDNAFGQWMLCGEAQPLNWAHIPVFNHGNLNDGVPHKDMEKELLATLFADPCIQRLIDALATQPFPARRDELAAHLRAVHLLALNFIRESYTRRGMHPAIPNADSLLASARNAVFLSVESISKFGEVAKQHPINGLQVDTFYISRQRMAAQLDFINFYNGRVDFQQANRNFICLTFPDEFVRQVETLIYPEWYAACFMRDCRNSAIWGSYGENHTAVCLKFRVTEGRNKPGLRLRRQIGVNGNGPIIDFFEHDFKEITYESEHLPVDFFRSLGRFPIPVLRQHWYSDENGNRSPCGDEIFRADDAWRKRLLGNVLSRHHAKAEGLAHRRRIPTHPRQLFYGFPRSIHSKARLSLFRSEWSDFWHQDADEGKAGDLQDY
jgi:hypothetical protein